MITRISLEHFKCFDLLHLPMAPLTLLSGPNASGKSSVLQPVVLLSQTMREYEWSTRLVLNGRAARLGTVTDVVDQVSGRDRFRVGLVGEEAVCHWLFVGDRRDMSLQVAKVSIEGDELTTDGEQPGRLHYLLPPDANDAARRLAACVSELTYISAGRESPREVYPLEDQYLGLQVGPEGQNAVSVLYRQRDEPIADALMLQETVPTLLHQVEGRLSSFFPGCRLEVREIANSNALTIGIAISQETGFLRPIHCGFGITQVLPIIVAALTATQGNILIIENPEVHLHPAGQAKMGQFLAEVAHSGVQVIIETHSDHVLNGIRRSVKSGHILPDEVFIHFFRPRFQDGAPQVISPTLDSSGNIDAWPDGFFDQFDKDMDYFAGWGE